MKTRQKFKLSSGKETELFARQWILPGWQEQCCCQGSEPPSTGTYLPAAHPIWALTRQLRPKIRLKVWSQDMVMITNRVVQFD